MPDFHRSFDNTDVGTEPLCENGSGAFERIRGQNVIENSVVLQMSALHSALRKAPAMVLYSMPHLDLCPGDGQ